MNEPAQADATPAKDFTILIVDDSAMMRMMIKRAAGLSGLPIRHIFEAADGQQGLEVLEQQHVDALFTDINMPVMTGIELLRHIAGQERWRHMIRVVISTDGSESRRSEADALSVHLYVEKPFRPEVMRDVLTSLIAAR